MEDEALEVLVLREGGIERPRDTTPHDPVSMIGERQHFPNGQANCEASVARFLFGPSALKSPAITFLAMRPASPKQDLYFLFLDIAARPILAIRRLTFLWLATATWFLGSEAILLKPYLPLLAGNVSLILAMTPRFLESKSPFPISK